MPRRSTRKRKKSGRYQDYETGTPSGSEDDEISMLEYIDEGELSDCAWTFKSERPSDSESESNSNSTTNSSVYNAPPTFNFHQQKPILLEPQPRPRKIFTNLPPPMARYVPTVGRMPKRRKIAQGYISGMGKKLLGIPGVSDAAFVSTDPANLKQILHGIAAKFYRQVDANWHDGWEEQGQTLVEYWNALEGPSNAVIEMCDQGQAFQRVCRVISTMCNSYRDLISTEMRGGTTATLAECDRASWDLLIEGQRVDFYRNTHLLFSYLWRYLLRSAAKSEALQDAHLNQFTKCAAVNDIEILDVMNIRLWLEKYTLEDLRWPERVTEVVSALLFFDEGSPLDWEMPFGPALDEGEERLNLLIENGNWERCRSQYQRYKRKHIIDRRFEGALDRRTRWDQIAMDQIHHMHSGRTSFESTGGIDYNLGFNFFGCNHLEGTEEPHY